MNKQPVQQGPFEFLKRLIQGTNNEDSIPKTPFYEAISNIINKQFLNLRGINEFFKQLNNQEKNCMINVESAIRHLDSIKFMICYEKTLYEFQPERRGYVLTGKAISLFKRTKKNQNEPLQDRQQRDSLISQIQRQIFRLHTQGKYPLQKWQRNYTVSDILMHFELPNSQALEPVLISNQVFPLFTVTQPTVIMTIPQRNYAKTANSEFLRSSLLHIYLDQAIMISRISTKMVLHKNSLVKGITFIEQGEVQVKSGRVVARGWVNDGVCRNSSFGWRFKPLNFLKFIAKSQNVWKQYLNDAKNNGQYPFDINAILTLNQDEDDQDYIAPFRRGHGNGHGKRNSGGKVKLPKLSSRTSGMTRSFDQGKYVEIEKLRHYDQKLDDMFYFKMDLLNKRMKGKYLKQFEPLIKNPDLEAAKQARIKRQLSKDKRNFNPVKRKVQNGQNVLIMSVLKRLQSLAAQQQESQDRKPRQSSRVYLQSKPSIGRISPLQLYHQNKKKKIESRRYRNSKQK